MLIPACQDVVEDRRWRDGMRPCQQENSGYATSDPEISHPKEDLQCQQHEREEDKEDVYACV
jgi:hypothetical protein